MNSPSPETYAHSTDDPSGANWEKLSDHLSNVATLAQANAAGFKADNWARTAGLLHDLGKCGDGFQAYLRKEQGSEPHSGEGARYAQENLGLAGKLLAYCIAGHHAGLPNGIGYSAAKPPTPLDKRINMAAKFALPDGITLPELIPVPAPLQGGMNDTTGRNYKLHFFTRMLFSALVDADFLETERFYDRIKNRDSPRGWHGSLAHLGDRLDAHLEQFDAPDGNVNELRAQILVYAREQATQKPGLFSLTVPTGGGKTLTSMAFALNHARHHELKRVIYVIPFTSIVEQTAEVFRHVFKDDDAVLEHHAAFDWDGIEDTGESERLRLAGQNWDRPVIVTTAVQFFESLFANRTSKCRKLHRFSKAVIILDEAHTLPLRLLRPCLAALKELARGYGASVVFCTATQPALIREDGFPAPEGLARSDIRELAPNPRDLYASLRRVSVCDAGILDDQELATRIQGQEQILVILNNRRHVQALFERIRNMPGARLLTTLMTAAHRRKTLEVVRVALAAGQPVRLVATSLIEAGVDVDFPQVGREVAGIDSIAQAAGRCNREGKQDSAEVFVFGSGEDFPPPADLRQFAEIGAEVLARHDDPLSLEAVHDYFRQLYWDRGVEALDAAQVGSTVGIMATLEHAGNQMDFPFADIAASFRMIEQSSVPLIIQGGDWGISSKKLNVLFHNPHSGAIARDFQPFLVQIPARLRRELLADGAASIWREGEFGEQFILLENDRLYDANAGFSTDDPEILGDMIL